LQKTIIDSDFKIKIKKNERNSLDSSLQEHICKKIKLPFFFLVAHPKEKKNGFIILPIHNLIFFLVKQNA
jgi:hypothetical protein